MSHRLHHRTYDPSVEKVVPKDAIVLDLAAANDTIPVGEVADTAVRTLRRSEFLSDTRLAEQIREQIPPHAPEPGPWGVVEASVESHGKERGRFVRDGADGYWECLDWSGTYGWDHLNNPVLIREGVES